MRTLLLFVLLAFSNYSWACSCGRVGILKSRRYAAVIFTGTLIKIATTTYTDTLGIYQGKLVTSPGKLVQFTFKINQLYKGRLQTDTISVTTSGGEADCGNNFAADRSYLIYSWYTDRRPNDLRENYLKVDNYLTTSLCSRTKAESFSTFYEKLLLKILS